MVSILPNRQWANGLDHVHSLYEQEVYDLGLAHLLNEQEANGLDNAYLLNEQLGSVQMLNEQYVNDIGRDHMLNEQHDNETMLNEQPLGNAYMLNKHHIKHLGNAYILNKQEVNNHSYPIFMVMDHHLVNYYDNHYAVYLANDQYMIAQLETVIYVNVTPLTIIALYASRSTQWSIFTEATGIVDPACDIALNTTQLLDSLRLLTQFYLKIMLTMSNVKSCHYSNTVSVTEKCHLIKLKLSQNILRRHDFKVFMESMRTKTPIANEVALLIVSTVLQCCQVWIIVQYPFRITWKVMRSTTAMTKGLRLLRLAI
jgi:hypothetical protein